jgi:hypothetical protein
MCQGEGIRTGRSGIVAACAALVVGVAAGCGGGSSETPSPGRVGGPDQTTAVTVTGPAGASVTVPPGAAPEPITVAIEQGGAAPAAPDIASAAGPVFTLTPHGAQFAEPVTVRIPLDPAQVGPDDQLVLLQAEPGEPWSVNLDVVRDGDAVLAPVTTFSLFQVAVHRGPPLLFEVAPEPLDPLWSQSGSFYALNSTAQRPFSFALRLTLSRPASDFCPAGARGWVHVETQFGANPRFKRLLGNLQAGAYLTEVRVNRFEASFAGTENFVGALTVSGVIHCGNESPLYSQGIRSSGHVRAPTSFRPRRLGFFGEPADVAVPEGDPAFFTLVVNAPQVQPTQDDHHVVEWFRSDDGGANWQAVALATQLDGTPEGGIYEPWRHTYAIASARPEDDGARFRVRVCYADSGTHVPDCLLSRSATLTVGAAVVPPSFTTQPASALVTAGQAASFTVAAAGTPAPTLQWQRRAPGGAAFADLPGETAATYTTPATSLADNGAQLRCLATSTSGTATSDVAVLSVSPAPVAPTIEVQPSDVSTAPGGTATFVVVARGTDPLAYWWRRDGVDVPGATGPSLTVPSVVEGDGGALFTVVVSNPAGTVTSAGATLTVVPAALPPTPPAIATQPAAASAVEGATANFTVSTTGTGPLSYQWLRSGAVIPGATLATYTTPVLALADDGSVYSVVVWNEGGTVVSATALLTVTPAPVVKAWAAPQPIGALVIGGFAPAVATDGLGASTAVWIGPDGGGTGVFAAEHAPGTGWASAAVIDTATGAASHFDVAASADGTAMAVWTQYDGTNWKTFARRRGAAGWEAVTPISLGAAEATHAYVAMDGAGGAVAVWREGAEGWTASYASGWGPPVRLATSGLNPRVALGASGDGVVAWWDGSAVQAALYAAGFGTPSPLGSGAVPVVAVSSDGIPAVVWMRLSGTTYEVLASRAPGGAFDTPVPIDSGIGASVQPDLALAAGPTGQLFAAWVQNDGTGNLRLWVNRFDGGWGAAQAISGPSVILQGPSLAVDGAGNAIAVWTQSDGAFTSVYWNRYEPGSGWGTPATLESVSVSAGKADVAMDAGGSATAVWVEDLTVVARRYE